MIRRLACSLFLVSLILVTIGCGGSQSSPEATFKTFTSAMEKRDFKTALSTMTPESQDTMVAGITSATMVVTMENPDKKVEVEKIDAKHGVQKIDFSKKSLEELKTAADSTYANVKDKGAYLSEIMQWLEKNQPAGMPNPSKAVTDIKLTDVKIEGDTAKGTVKRTSSEMSQPIEFKKVNGVWLISLAI
jgi:hypothetical protein